MKNLIAFVLAATLLTSCGFLKTVTKNKHEATKTEKSDTLVTEKVDSVSKSNSSETVNTKTEEGFEEVVEIEESYDTSRKITNSTSADDYYPVLVSKKTTIKRKGRKTEVKNEVRNTDTNVAVVKDKESSGSSSSSVSERGSSQNKQVKKTKTPIGMTLFLILLLLLIVLYCVRQFYAKINLPWIK
jgi:ABC-type Na+ efflux pump permease subunit